MDLETQKSRLEENKQKLKMREKMLKEKEKRVNQRSLGALGELFLKAEISHLDHEILMGALLEIAEKSKNEESLSSWRKKSQQYNFENREVPDDKKAITISFKSPPPFEIKEKLKEMNFKWNSFRGEYYGFGQKQDLSGLLEKHEHKIEVIK